MLSWAALGVLIAVAGVAAYAVLVERRAYRLARYRLDILPTGTAERIQVLHLSDLHMVSDDSRKERFIASLPKPDVVVVTGDILGEPQAVETAVRTLRAVRGRLASLFVLGSNDLYEPRPFNYLKYFIPHDRRQPRFGRRGRSADLVRMLESEGWVHMKNRKYDRRANGIRLEIAGLDDPYAHRADLRVGPRVVPEAFGLAVVHAPDPAPELIALGYDLVLAGHTHGGQVRLPLVGALVTNSSLPTRFARGLVRFGPGYLHVSPGLGTSKYAPFRFLCPPEATLLELRAERTPQPRDTTSSKTAS
ncbi:MAG: metallophosphoesterase [Actinomycetota bacterium]